MLCAAATQYHGSKLSFKSSSLPRPFQCLTTQFLDRATTNVSQTASQMGYMSPAHRTVHCSIDDDKDLLLAHWHTALPRVLDEFHICVSTQ